MEPSIAGKPEVVKKLREVAKRSMTPAERHEQTVSFVMGTMGGKSTITREEIEKIVKEQS